MRIKKLVTVLVVLAMLAALAACSSSAGQSGGQSGGEGGSQSQEAPEEQAQNQEAPEDKKMTEEAKKKEVAPQAGNEQPAAGPRETKVDPPQDKTLKLTVPKMAEIKNDTIPTGLGTNDALFRDYAGVHLKRTGFPWQETANVYIAGHRIGFPGTNSDMAFYDLNELAEGDEVSLTDAEGRRYTYEVFDKLVVPPTDLSVLKPIKGKNIVSLQTCTLPDYTKRLIVRAELKDIRS